MAAEIIFIGTIGTVIFVTGAVIGDFFFLSECCTQRVVVRAVALLSAKLSEKRKSSEMIGRRPSSRMSDGAVRF